MCVSVYYTTTKGKYHKNNEDSLFIGDRFIIIADGMGGENNGDIASKIAVDTISRYLKVNLNSDNILNLKEIMFSAIKKADDDISKYAEAHHESYGMGTTVLLLVYGDDLISVAWCGDSRCYTYKEGELQSLTKDHSYVQELIDANKISVEESFTHPDNNLITRYVGGGKNTCEPEFISYNMMDVDTIILCSDGLSGYCRINEIRHLLSSNTDPSLLPSLLTDMAIDHGSDDDITIVILSTGNANFPKKHISILDWLRRKS